MSQIMASLQRHLVRAIWVLLGSLLLTGAAGGAEPGLLNGSAGLSAFVPRAYRVVNLPPGRYTGLTGFNTKDQFAISLVNEAGASRAYFHDGHSVRDIGTLGGSEAVVSGINDAGEVTGHAFLPGDVTYHAFKWHPRDGMRDLGALAAGGTSDAGADQPINERGHVVGYASTATGAYHAFLWTPADGMRDLGALPSNSAGLSFANVVNNTGLVAGQGTLVNGATNGMAWTARRGMVEIPTLGGTPSGASIITDAGMVGGTSGTPSGFIHAFTWTQQGGVRDLGTAGYDESFLAGTRSSNGYVAAGLRNFGGYTERAALWLGVPGTPLIDLGTFGGPISFCSDVNNKAHVVGQADISTYNRVPFIWSFRDGMVPLNTRIRHAPPGLVVSYPFRLSNSGRILSSTMAGNFVLLKPDCNCGGSHSHTVGPVDTPDTVQVGGSFDASVSFTDDDATARHNIVWTWGDGTGSQQGNAQERGGAGRASASHRYTAPGIYTVSVQVGDRSGQGPTVTRTIVAYSPGPGGAVGNGWIISPAGAMANSLHDTRAAFSVLVPASTADRTLAAQASLRFHVGRLNFRSDTLARVPAQDGHARFEGSGTVNGKQGYRFNLALSAGAPEPGQAGRVGLKIWHRDAVTNRDMIDYQHADNHHDEASADTAPVSQGQIILQ